MLSIAGPLPIALPTPWPRSARGMVTQRLTYIPIPYSTTTSTRTARLPPRSLARLAVATVRTGRAGDFASRVMRSPHCLWFGGLSWAAPVRAPGRPVLAVARRVGNPARDGAQVVQVGGAEAAGQRRFLVAGHEQVEKDPHRAR